MATSPRSSAHSRASKPRQQFNGNYYHQFYQKDPVHTAERVADLAQAVDSLCRWWNAPVKSFLDVGSGPGYWRDWYRAKRPDVRVLSTDISDYACKTYGHQKRDISKWKPGRSYDLVVCHGVLQYLSDRAAASAIKNLAAATREVLYLEIPTQEDMNSVIDADATDLEMHIRPASWYRTRLTQYFDQAGSGLWIAKKGKILLYALEGAPRA